MTRKEILCNFNELKGKQLRMKNEAAQSQNDQNKSLSKKIGDLSEKINENEIKFEELCKMRDSLVSKLMKTEKRKSSLIQERPEQSLSKKSKVSEKIKGKAKNPCVDHKIMPSGVFYDSRTAHLNVMLEDGKIVKIYSMFDFRKFSYWQLNVIATLHLSDYNEKKRPCSGKQAELLRFLREQKDLDFPCLNKNHWVK